MRSLSRARQRESDLDRGIDLLCNPSSNDLKHLTGVEADLEGAVAKGDLASVSARQNEIEQEIAADERHLHTKGIVDGIASAVLTTAPLFIPGPVGLVGAIIMNGLAQSKPAEKLSDQLLDFGLGGTKGALMKGAFALGSAMNLGIAGRALLLSPSQRVLSVGLNRETYLSSSGQTDIPGGLEETAKQAVNPINIATDISTFALAAGLAVGLDKVAGGAISASPLLSTVTTGGIFGFASGASHEVRTEWQANGHLNLPRVALAGAEGAAVSAIVAVPGGLIAAHGASAESQISAPQTQATDDNGVPDTQSDQAVDSITGNSITGTAITAAHWAQLPQPSNGELPSIQAPGDYEQNISFDGVALTRRK
jgi:hypothetical protein